MRRRVECQFLIAEGRVTQKALAFRLTWVVVEKVGYIIKTYHITTHFQDTRLRNKMHIRMWVYDRLDVVAQSPKAVFWCEYLCLQA
jgi:hypothetical protein